MARPLRRWERLFYLIMTPINLALSMLALYEKSWVFAAVTLVAAGLGVEVLVRNRRAGS
jgi:hypothetical protein